MIKPTIFSHDYLNTQFNNMKKIQILGLEDNSHKDLLQTLKKALQELCIDADVEEITEIDAFLKHNLLRIPALAVNGQVIFHHNNHDIGLEELKGLLRKHFSNQFIMENILVPTDFSNTALGAYQYALQLADYFNAKVKAIHVYHPSYDPGQPLGASSNMLILEPKRELMEKFVAQRPQSEDGTENTMVTVDSEVVSGFAAEEIVRLTKSGEIDLVVMGTTGENTLMEKIFGSISSDVSKHAHCPVLLVPKGAKFRAFRNVVYASDFEKTDSKVMETIIDFAGRFSAGIHLVDVHECNEKGRYKVEEQVLEQQLNERLPALEFRMAEVECDTVWEGLNLYADDHEVDLFVMVTKHRKFWENILHRSMTRQMAIHSRKPILILHHDD